MRNALAFVVLAASIALGCGGKGSSSDAAALPPDQLSFDAAPAFAGRWYGTATLTIGARTASVSSALDVAVVERNLLRFANLCSDASSPAVRVTSGTAFTVVSHACLVAFDDCEVTWNIRGGTGIADSGVLAVTLDGSSTGCGVTQAMALTFTGTRTPPGAVVDDRGPPQVVLARAVVSGIPNVPILLDASASADPDGRPLAFAWTITGQPAGATVTLADATTSRPRLTTDAVGAYTVQVAVTAADGQSATASLTVNVSDARPMSALAHRVIDAGYSRALERIVMTDAGPDALYVYDPASGTESRVLLPKPAQCLGVSVDGTHAIVGHDAWISWIDLASATLLKTIPTTVNAESCALKGDWAYVFPRNTWFSVHSVNVVTGVETGGSYPYSGSRGVLTPDGNAMYAVTLGLSPADVKRWNTSAGAAAWAWEMAYHGDYAVGDRVWMERSGARIFTAAGTAFRTSSLQPQDMLYAGSLSGAGQIQHLDSSLAEIAAIPAASAWSTEPSTADTTVELYEPTYLGHAGRIVLPGWYVGGQVYKTHGRFVFYTSDGAAKLVIVQADPSSGLVQDAAVLTY